MFSGATVGLKFAKYNSVSALFNLSLSGLYYICQTYDRFSHVAMILVSQ